MARKEERSDELWGGEYATVSFGLSWNVISVFCALLSLTSIHWVYYLPIQLSKSWHRPMLVPLVSVSFGVLGLLVALVGRFRGEKTKAGLFLNATICGITLAMAASLAIWWSIRR